MNAPVDCQPEQNQEKGKPLFFPRGIPGLDQYRHYYIEQVSGSLLFYVLQSADDEDVGIYLVDPFPVFPTYRVNLTEVEKKELGISSDQNVIILTTVTVEGKNFFTNLVAPVIINPVQRLGKQLILTDQPLEHMRAEINIKNFE